MDKRVPGIAIAIASALFGLNVAGPARADDKAAQADRPPNASLASAASSRLDDSKSLDRLQQASQRLREAVQTMAQEPPGPRRNQAMEAAREALFDTQQAMVQLPPALRTGDVPGIDYTRSMDQLKIATQKLREAIQTMAQQPAGPRRNEAIEEAHEAIRESHQAMILLPSDARAVN